MRKIYDENIILKNMASLMSSQAINFILPLITYPYIIKIIGIAHFGKIQFVLTCMTFLALLVDFGYNYKAPREVALLKENHNQLSKLVSRVFTFKIVVFVVLSLGTILYAILFAEEQYLLYLGGLVFLLNLSMSPNWFFQGVERMEFIAVVDVAAKVIFTGSIFVFIKHPDDYVYILPLWGLGGIISAVAGIILILYQYRLKFKLPKITIIKEEISEGYLLFVSTLATHVITNSQIILLGVFHGSIAVGIYAIAEKVVKIPWALANVFSQVIYPRVCIVNKEGAKKVLAFFRNTLPYFYGLCIILLALIWIFSHDIIGYLTKDSIEEIIGILKLLSFSVLLVLFNVPFQQYILANGWYNILMKIFLMVAVTNVLFSSIFIYYWSFTGAAWSSILTMCLLLISLIFAVKSSVPKLSLQ